METQIQVIVKTCDLWEFCEAVIPGSNYGIK